MGEAIGNRNYTVIQQLFNYIILEQEKYWTQLEALRSTCRVAILYALGYLYEHRDEADHHQLMLTLRSILFAVREGVF